MAEVTLKEAVELLEFMSMEEPRLVTACLEGAAGLGKSSAGKQFAEKMGYPLVFVNTAAVLTEPGDILGLPIEKDGVTHYAPPFWVVECQKLAADPQIKKIVLMFDDFSRVPAQILQSMMSIFLDRKIGAASLPEKVFLLLTGNPSKKKEYATRALDRAQQERIQVINVRFDLECFLQYANTHDFNPEWMAYCAAYSENFMDDGKKGAAMSPRTAEFASQALNAIKKKGYPLDHRIAKTRLDSIVGESIRESFLVCLKHQQDIIPPDKILEGSYEDKSFNEMMKRPDLMYLTYTRLASELTKLSNNNKISQSSIKNLRRFIMRVERDEMNFLFLNIIPQKTSKAILDGDTFTIMRNRLWGG
jgi:hypothetical protein